MDKSGLKNASAGRIWMMWQVWGRTRHVSMRHWFINLSSGFLSPKVVRLVRVNPHFIVALVASTLVSLVHPALGLFVLLASDALCCHNALCSHTQREEFMEYEEVSDGGSLESSNKCNGMEDSSSNSPGSAKSFADTQLEIFHHQHGLLILHLMAALMFVPSLNDSIRL